MSWKVIAGILFGVFVVAPLIVGVQDDPERLADIAKSFGKKLFEIFKLLAE